MEEELEEHLGEGSTCAIRYPVGKWGTHHRFCQHESYYPHSGFIISDSL